MQLTDYIPTVPGNRNVKIYSSQNNTLLLEIPTIEIPFGQIMTGAFYGMPNGLRFLSITDDINETVMPDETKVRFYNLNAYAITFTLTPTVGLESRALASGEGTSYSRINPGEYNLQITFSNQRPKNVKIRFNPGRIYTLYIISSINPSSPDYLQSNIPQIVLVVDGNTLYDKCNHL